MYLSSHIILILLHSLSYIIAPIIFPGSGSPCVPLSLSLTFTRLGTFLSDPHPPETQATSTFFTCAHPHNVNPTITQPQRPHASNKLSINSSMSNLSLSHRGSCTTLEIFGFGRTGDVWHSKPRRSEGVGCVSAGGVGRG